ncbi:MAG: hypothetical protein WKF31_10895 [Thermoleophilaceae bacterium]
MGFRISDWQLDGSGFTVSDFDELVVRGSISFPTDAKFTKGSADSRTAPQVRGGQPKTRLHEPAMPVASPLSRSRWLLRWPRWA